MNSFDKFLKDLEDELYFFSEEEIEQIILDYQELYNVKIEAGEKESDIVKGLDTPKEIASNYAKEMNLNTSKISKVYVNCKKDLKKHIKDVKVQYNEFIKRQQVKKEESRERKNEKKTEKNIGAEDDTNNNLDNSNFFELVADFIKRFVKNIFYTLLSIVLLLFKISKILLIIAIWLLMVGLILLYIFSFIFIDIDFYNFYYRFFETTAFVGFMMCSIVILMLLKDKRE